jgi:hypothetical protein
MAMDKDELRKETECAAFVLKKNKQKVKSFFDK